MNQRPKSEQRQATEIVSVRFTPEQLEQVTKAAFLEELSMSGFLRQCVRSVLKQGVSMDLGLSSDPERQKEPTGREWDRMKRSERIETALKLLVDAVRHEHREHSFSLRVQNALAIFDDLFPPIPSVPPPIDPEDATKPIGVGQ